MIIFENVENIFRFIKTFIQNSEDCLFGTYSNISRTTFSIEWKIWYTSTFSNSFSSHSLHLGLNQIGHFNTENVTKLTKTKPTIAPVEETEVRSKMEVDEDGEIHDL